MLSNTVRVSYIFQVLLDWCSENNVSSGMLYQQVSYVKKELISSQFGKDLSVEFKNIRINKKDNTAQLLEKSFTSLYAPILILLDRALRLNSERNLFDILSQKLIKKAGIVNLEIRIADGLFSKEKIEEMKQKIYNMYDYRVELTVKVDSSLLNGWVIFNDFKKIDNSDLAKLNKLIDQIRFENYSS